MRVPVAQHICNIDRRSSTSPSVYLQVLGTMAINDECATVGPILTSPIMTFPPGGLSTWKPPPADYGENFSVGASWELAAPDMTGIVAPLTIRDLACPTWGLGRSTSADGEVITTIGPPWLPLIAPPKEAFSLDPTWASICTAMLSDWMGLDSFALFDPPIALTRGSGLVSAPLVPVVAPTSTPALNLADSTTVTDKQGTRPTEAAKPAPSPVDPAQFPTRTKDRVEFSSSPSLAIAPSDMTKPESPAFVPVPAPTKESDPTFKSEVPQPVTPANAAVGAKDPLADHSTASPDVPTPSHDDSPAFSADPKASVQPSSAWGDDVQQQTQGLGALIYNAFGESGPQIGVTAKTVKSIPLPTAGIQKISIGGGQLLSIDPSGLVFEGSKDSVGRPAMTLSNNIYTIVPQHKSVHSASNEDDGLIKSAALFANTLVIADQTVVPNPTGFVIAGSSVLPDSIAVTISKTPVSLDLSGILAVGSSRFSLPPQSVFTVGTRSFTANPTGFVLDGATITPGAVAQTVDGTAISLGRSGALTLGSITISLQSPSATPTTTTAFTVAGQPFTPNPSAFSIAGTTIFAGGPTVTVAGTVISLQSSGTLILGSSTIPLLASRTASPPVLNINGFSVEAQSSLAIVDGVTIRPGAADVTVDGTNVSLEAGGSTLDVGTGRFAMPTEIVNGSAGSLIFEGGQRKGVETSLISVLILTIGWNVMLIV